MFYRMLLVVWTLLLPACVSVVKVSSDNLMKKDSVYDFPNSMRVEMVGGKPIAFFDLRIDPVSGGTLYLFTFPILNYEYTGKGFVCPTGQRPMFIATGDDRRDRMVNEFSFFDRWGDSKRKRVYFDFTFQPIAPGTLVSMYSTCVTLPN
jgi:hypothetical protein